MKRALIAVALGLFCAGCFQSDAALYAGVKPLQPFHAGPVTSRDKDGKMTAMTLTLGADGVYQLTPKKAASGSADIVLLRFFPLAGTAPDQLVAEVRDCGDSGIKQCAGSKSFNYELARVLPDRVEWRDPDCSKTFSKLAGVAVTIDSCKFGDRVSLEKALRVAAAMPWQADGAYLLHGAEQTR
jgi:hypothetical protein